jgi:hypothetical protein
MSNAESTITVGNHYIIGYCDGKGTTSVRHIEVLKLTDTGFMAHCHLRNSCRTFLTERVSAVYAAPHPAAAAIVVRLGRTLTTVLSTAALDSADAAMLADAVDDARRLYRAVA